MIADQDLQTMTAPSRIHERKCQSGGSREKPHDRAGLCRGRAGQSARQGHRPRAGIESIGIDPESFGPVSNEQYGALWLSIATLSGDEFFGLAAHPMRPGAFRLLCYTVIHAGTLERALRRALTFLNIVLDDPNGELRQAGGLAEIVLTDQAGPRSAFTYRTYWLILLGIACWLIGRRIPLSRVDLSCSEPVNRQEYHQFFGAPVHFGERQSRIAFRADYLKLPIIRDEKALKGFLRAAPANILLRYRHDQGFTAGVRHRLRAVNPDSWPDFEDVAAQMKLSPATLRRRLKAEGRALPPFATRYARRKRSAGCATAPTVWPRSLRRSATRRRAPFIAPFRNGPA